MTDIPLSSMVALTGGANFWQTNAVDEADLPRVMLTDGPHGVRKQVGDADHVGLNESAPATCFPPAVGLAATWDRGLVRRVGAALGTESAALGVGVLLGPGINIKRDPRCGRNFEYFSEDPHVSGELATAYVDGVQSRGVGTSLKHFAANNQETDRMRRDSQIDERTLREVYLRAFGIVVTRAQPWTVMCSYNRLNGIPAAEHRWLLTDVLRGEWGFDGVVVSDWGAVRDRVASLQAGLDLQMPGDSGAGAAAVEAALADGRLGRETVETAYGRIARVLRRAVATLADAPDGFDAQAHHALAREAASEAIVLLSNDGVLPLAPETRVAVIGEFARTPRYQGAGSSRVNPTRLDNALDAIAALVGHEVPFAPGFTTVADRPVGEDAHSEAVAVARDADVVLAFLGLGENHESEGYDRTTIDLPAEQLALLEDVLAVNPNVVVVLSNGSSVLVPFAGRVRAVVEGWLLGQAGGPAIADVLYGLVNPSGKITETIPHRLADVPAYPHFPGDATGVRYGEGLFVGYRGYDATDRAVAFPFGHGLSYTTFEYADLRLVAGPDGVTATVRVTNTGAVAGREVVQAYVGVPDSKVVRPPRELKGFADVRLAAGESTDVTVEIGDDDLRYWSVPHQAWLLEGATYAVSVGSSSRDLRASATVDLAGDEPAQPLTLESTLGEILAVPGGAEVLGQALGAFAADADADNAKMFAEIPAYALADFNGAGREAVQRLLDRVNAEARLG